MDSWLHTLVANEDVEGLRELFVDPEWRQFVDEPDEHGQTPLTAMLRRESEPNLEILDLLLSMGADPNGHCRILEEVTRPDIALTLLQAGADPSDLSRDTKFAILGIDRMSTMTGVSKEDYEQGKRPHFGSDNPTKYYNRYREAMIRCGWNGYGAREHFKDPYGTSHRDPVWCMDRLGQSLTAMPDGRLILVAGEHEDSSDPDFCIYNDVIVVHPGGQIEMFTYPKEVFPPTDFHTATLIGRSIYLIGSLGYGVDRHPGATPVYRLDTEYYSIEKLKTTGDSPGHIYEHRATLVDGSIQVQGGREITSVNGQQNIVAMTGTYRLNLDSLAWSARNTDANEHY